MQWQVLADSALEAWSAREHPDDEVQRRVFDALLDLGDRKDFPLFCIAYPIQDEGEHYEFMIEGTRVFVEFWVFVDIGYIDVVEIASASFPR